MWLHKGGIWTHYESLHLKLTLGEKSIAAPGNRTCVSGMTVWCSTNELHPYLPHTLISKTTQIHTYSCMHIYAHMRPRIHTHTHWFKKHTNIHTYAWMHMHAHTHTHISLQTHTCTNTHAHIHRHTHTHAHKHPCNHTHALTHTHTHTYTHTHHNLLNQ